MFRAMLRREDDEKSLADGMEMYLRRAGGKCGSFPAIVAGGPRAALPHAPPTGARVGDQPLLLVDWGASGTFYKSDLTRVLWWRENGARPTEKLAEIYAVVLEAQRRAIAAVRPGTEAPKVDAAARSYIADAGYGSYFTHGLGHGLGLQVHEAPSLRPTSTTVLEAGMVVTIEPGVYLPGWGGVRIEDDVLVTADGVEVLTNCPKDLEACGIEP
jgi:Xaa-Pro aminopeptidase